MLQKYLPNVITIDANLMSSWCRIGWAVRGLRRL